MNYIASWAGTDNLMGVNFKQQMRLLLLWIFAVSFRETALNSFYIDFFHDFIHVYSPRARTDNLG